MDYKTRFLTNFKLDIEDVTEHFWRLEVYRPYRTCAQANAAEQPNVKASFLSLVIQAEEWRIVNVAMEKAAREYPAYKVNTYVFDGVKRLCTRSIFITVSRKHAFKASKLSGSMAPSLALPR